jgi:hypothetical protein
MRSATNLAFLGEMRANRCDARYAMFPLPVQER